MTVIQIQVRRDTAANWTSANPVLAAGEHGLDTTAGRLKIGDGTTAWNSLAYQNTRMLSGSGAPSNALGVDGDYYISTGASPNLYGPKAAGVYPAGVSLVGPQGSQGIQGVTGAGVPTGGTTGQVLAKIDNTNYNTQWSTPADPTLKFDRTNGTLVGVASPTYVAGKLVYDTDNESLTFFNNDSNIALQVGQEQWIRVRNTSGSTITNGSAVYITGASSGLPTIGLAKADAAATSTCVGLATENIANNTIGYITSAGIVRGLNTAGFSAGAVVYLSAATAGGLSATRPAAPNFSQRIGVVAVSDASVGSIYANPAGTGLGLGTANQLLGMDAAGTAQEYKAATAAGLAMVSAADVAAQTALLNSATSSLKGLMSPADKRAIDNIWFDVVADYGFVGDDSTDNLAAFNSMLTALPVGACVYFPPGTYRVSGELNVNVDKRISFVGANRYASIIKTTSTTANIFNVSIPAWYNSWSDLGFQSSVTKTAGAAIAISSGSAVGTNVYRCWMTGLFKGIDAQGAQSGNLSIWTDLDISAIPNGGRGIQINGSTINVMIHNVTINAGAATTSACCEINQSGAVQVTGCDWIQGTNVVLLNSTGGAGPQAVYFTNCFFDQPQASVIKIMGTNTANRIKFTQCGIATFTSGFHGIEIAGTGAGGVGTSTALPAGLSIVDCDIYHQAGTSTGSGIMVNGAQDANIANTRITGYNGSGGCGIQITPSGAGLTSVRINGCIIGPNSNLTVTNDTGVKVNAGTIGRLAITDNAIMGWTTAGIVDSSTAGYPNNKNIAGNDGAQLVVGPMVRIGAPFTTTGTGENIVLQAKIPAKLLAVGTTLRVNMIGQSTGVGTVTSRLRIGTAGTTADGPLVTAGMASAAQVANAWGKVEFYGTVSTVGAAGTFVGAHQGLFQAVHLTMATAALAAGAGQITINTTVDLFITVTLAVSAGTFVVRSGFIEIESS